MVLVGSKYIFTKYSKHGFGWAKNTYSKNTQKLVAGCPKGLVTDSKQKLYFDSVSMAEGH